MDFEHAIKVGNIVTAELAAREMRGLDLADALDLTALIALRDRGRRAAARWLQRWLDETPGPTIDAAVMIGGALAALGGPSHAIALEALRATARSARP